MIINPTYAANLAVIKGLEAEFQNETWYNTFWSKMAGAPNVSQAPNGNQVIGMPTANKVVQVYSNLNVEEGRDSVRIPFERIVYPTWVYGDETLKGTGVEQTLDFMDGFINQSRAAVVALSGRMSNKRIQIMDMMMRAKPQLMNATARHENGYGWQAIYEGAGENLTAGRSVDGLGLSVRFHPNFYRSASGDTITAIGTEYAFKTADELDAAYNSCSTATASSKISAELLDSIEVQAKRLRIPQIVNKNGYPYYLLVISPEMHKTLKQDDTYKAAQREAYSTMMVKSPELHSMNVVGYYGGFAICEDWIGARSWDKDSDTFAPNGWEQLPATSKKSLCAVVLGANALIKNQPDNWNFTMEMDDHDNFKEIGVNGILGYNRPDFVTEANLSSVYTRGASSRTILASAASYTAVNQSSMIVMIRK